MKYFSRILFLFFIAILPFAISFAQSKSYEDTEKSIEQIREYLTKGTELVSQEKYEEALFYVQKAIEIQDDNAELYRLEGQILEMLERTEESIAAWKKCLQTARNDELIKEAKLHLQSLKEKE